jgi:uncharacterized protein YjbI with pentapeptide repeats
MPSAKLGGVNLAEANLSGANLSNGDLSGCNLSNANLEGADLSNASLEGTNLSNSNLSTANLSRANLKDANLKGANLLQAKLEGATLPFQTVDVTQKLGRLVTQYSYAGTQVVFALPSGSAALRLRAVTLQSHPSYPAREMEVLTAPQEQGPWTSLLRFECANTGEGQMFGAVGDLPAIDQFVKVIVHSTYYGYEAIICNMSLLCEELGADE